MFRSSRRELSRRCGNDRRIVWDDEIVRVIDRDVSAIVKNIEFCGLGSTVVVAFDLYGLVQTFQVKTPGNHHPATSVERCESGHKIVGPIPV